MREDFKGKKFSHSVNLAGNEFGHLPLKESLLRFINLDYNAQIAVARDKDRDSMGPYGFICTGDVIAAYDIDCLSRLDADGNRVVKGNQRQCTVEEWDNAFFYTEAILTHTHIECMFYRQERRGAKPDDVLFEVAKQYGYDVIIVPYSTRRQEMIIRAEEM